MLISAKNDVVDLIFFSPKEAQLLFRQLQKLSARNISALKCESQKTKSLGTMEPPLMQLSVKAVKPNVKNVFYATMYQCWSESGLGLGLNGWVRVRVRTRVRTRTLVLWTRTRTRTPPLWTRTQALWTRTLVLWTRTRTRTPPRWTRTHSESRWVRWEMHKTNLNFHVQ